MAQNGPLQLYGTLHSVHEAHVDSAWNAGARVTSQDAPQQCSFISPALLPPKGSMCQYSNYIPGPLRGYVILTLGTMYMDYTGTSPL